MLRNLLLNYIKSKNVKKLFEIINTKGYIIFVFIFTIILYSCEIKNKIPYINHEMYRRIAENKAKFPAPRKVKMSPKTVYKSKVEFGPWYTNQLHQYCQIIGMNFLFWPGVIFTVFEIVVGL